MFFSEETYRAAIVAAIQSQGPSEDVGAVIQQTVSALQAAELKPKEHETKFLKTNSEGWQPSHDKE